MKEMGYFIAKLKFKLCGNRKESISEYFRKHGMKIGDNCFIGARSLIMYGVELANNIIVAAGSVVCNSFYNEGVIIGGNPAKVIGTWDDFENKISIHGMKSGKAREICDLESKEFIVRGSKLE